MIAKNSYEYIVNVEFPNIFQAIEKILKPQNKGFELVYSGLVPGHPPTILYQSYQCKMRIRCSRDRPYDDIELSVTYGRLHALDNDDLIEWNGEKCYCWHRLTASPLLLFLDGLSPAEAVKLTFSRIEDDLFKLSRDKEWTVPEHFARKHAMIWKHYDQRFFDLFDLNYPNLWQEYATFLKDYYEIDSEKTKMLKAFFNGVHHPFLYKVC
ncbi:hypothetical protein KKG22_05630 [Patescibacteria group bacterium]|nr:hypothetical protein [Patescibacteria group bacterium]